MEREVLVSTEGKSLLTAVGELAITSGQFGLLPVFLNKVLLEHTCAHLSVYYLWLFLNYNSRMESM